MTLLFLDIESIPAQSQAAKDRIAATIKPPAQMKKAETIAAWEKDCKEQAVQEAIDKTSFDGGLGHVCCIGWAMDDGEIFSQEIHDVSDEVDILTAFFDAVSSARMHPVGLAVRMDPITIVGHYVSGFDIRFLTQRSIVLGVKLPAWWPVEEKPWGDRIFDTMVKWAGVKGTISLDNLCFALGIEGKGDVDGSMVAQMFANGEHEAISRYCRSDVERVRLVHKRMIAALGGNQ